jgi:pyruvate dehydrogenase E2 component (dihydrolipoamide acetyltransferase)
MGQVREVTVPDIGGFDAVDVVEVLVAPGDRVAVDDPLITLESDKASMDVPTPFAGVVKELRVSKGDKVGEGATILTLEVSGEEGKEGKEEAGAAPAEPEEPAQPAAAAQTARERTGATPGGAAEKPARPAEPAAAPATPETAAAPRAPAEAAEEAGFALAHASPAVRRLARELGVDLTQVSGSGRQGRVLKEDVQGFVKAALGAQPGGAAGPAAGAGIPPMPAIDFSRFGPVETRPLSRIRRATGANLHRAWLHVPHVTQHDEVDVTDLEAFRKAAAEEVSAKGAKLTFLPFLVKAAVAALKEFPDFNSSLSPDGGSLVVKQYYSIGVAVDTAEGLLVPVVKNADGKGIVELARELADLAARAREGKLRLDEVQGGTFSISSLGGLGGTTFTPLVNAPEVAILGVSRAAMRPVWSDGRFVPRLLLPLSLSYDHRVVDGAAAVRFLTHLGRALADLRRLLL